MKASNPLAATPKEPLPATFLKKELKMNDQSEYIKSLEQRCEELQAELTKGLQDAHDFLVGKSKRMLIEDNLKLKQELRNLKSDYARNKAYVLQQQAINYKQLEKEVYCKAISKAKAKMREASKAESTFNKAVSLDPVISKLKKTNVKSVSKSGVITINKGGGSILRTMGYVAESKAYRNKKYRNYMRTNIIVSGQYCDYRLYKKDTSNN